MTPSNPQVYRCSRCGQIRPMEELNGLVLVNGRWVDDRAYCYRLEACKSTEADAIRRELIAALKSENNQVGG